MGQAIREDRHDIIENVVTPTIHADAVARIRFVDADVHLVLYAKQVTPQGDVEDHVVGRIVMPLEGAIQSTRHVAERYQEEAERRRRIAM